MLTFRNLSMQWKLLWMNMLASGVALLLICTAFALYDRVTFREVMVRQLTAQAEIVSSNSASALLFDDADAATETLAALRAEPRIIAAGIYRIDGRRFAIYDRQAPAGATMLPAQLDALADGHRFEHEHLVLFRSIVGGGQTIGTVYILADLHELQQRLTRYLSIAGMVGLASFALALWISSLFQRRISGPLVQLAQATRSVSAQRDYAVRAPVNSRDELGLLGESFNEMLTQINGGMQHSNRPTTSWNSASLSALPSSKRPTTSWRPSATAFRMICARRCGRSMGLRVSCSKSTRCTCRTRRRSTANSYGITRSTWVN